MRTCYASSANYRSVRFSEIPRGVGANLQCFANFAYLADNGDENSLSSSVLLLVALGSIILGFISFHLLCLLCAHTCLPFKIGDIMRLN